MAGHTAFQLQCTGGVVKGRVHVYARVWRQSRVMDEDDGPLGRDWLGEISEMLVNGGYFRARMTSISPFDKVHPPR